MRSSIDLYNESYNYYDLLICDTLLFDVSDLVIYESNSTSNKEKNYFKEY